MVTDTRSDTPWAAWAVPPALRLTPADTRTQEHVAMIQKSSVQRQTRHADLLPYPDFPLSPHPATNRWYKKIRGRRIYFGPLADPDAALEKYQRERDYLMRGATP